MLRFAAMLSRLGDRISYARLSLNLLVYLTIAIVLFLITVVVPAVAFDVPEVDQGQGETQRATILRVLEERTEDGPRGRLRYQRLEVEVAGRVVEIEHSAGELDARQLDLEAGDRVLVSSPPGGPEPRYFIVDHVRDSQLWVFGLVFVVLVLLVGRWQGVTSLIGMAASLLVILRFIIPGIVSGHSPVTISIIGAAVILATSLYLAHGVNRKTTTALLGTTFALASTAALAVFAVDFAKLSGLADEQAATLNIFTSGGINPQGLLLAGMIIGALGVLDDVTVAQSSAVFELRAANPGLTPLDLFRRAMNIGRDHIASTVNTLFLAYAGAALPLLILLSLQAESTGTLVTQEFLATEVIRTLVGSIGIVASVPITTALAAASTRVWLPWMEPGSPLIEQRGVFVSDEGTGSPNSSG
jgi:uncharacterized membrane protein